MGRLRLANYGDAGALACRSQSDGEADAARSAGNEQGLAAQRYAFAHGWSLARRRAGIHF